MAIQDVIDHAQAAITSAVTAIKYAPSYPTDKVGSWPSAMAFATDISIEPQGGFVLTFFNLRIDVLIPRRDLNENMRQLAGIPEAVAAVFTADPTIGGHCQTFGQEIKANLINLNFNGMEMIGYTIIVGRIKI
jgi:hypothetical protein